jgi:hypothetical protein
MLLLPIKNVGQYMLLEFVDAMLANDGQGSFVSVSGKRLKVFL